MRLLLLYNPKAGPHRGRRLALVHEAARQFTSFGHEVEVDETRPEQGIDRQVRQAVADGVEAVFACGGDGTVHHVLQGIAGTSAALGLLPMGSANALCRELGIAAEPVAAAQSYGTTRVLELPLWTCACENTAPRYFLAMAGAGPDGALMHRMIGVDRGRHGRWLYAVHALRMLWSGKFPSFRVRYRPAGSDGSVEAEAVSALAMRIARLGGTFPGVGRGASITGGSLRLVLNRGPAWLSLPLWFLSNWLRMERWNPLLTVANVDAFDCLSAIGDVHVQADGEYLRYIPLQVRPAEETVRLLLPGC